MALQTQYDFSRPASQLSMDRKSAVLFDDCGDAILDDFDGVMISPTADRRASFGHGSVIFSSAPNRLEPMPASQTDQFTPGVSNNPFFAQSNSSSGALHNNNPFTRLGSSQAASYGQQSSSWPWDDAGNCTPSTATYDAFPAEYDPIVSSAFPPTARNDNMGFCTAAVMSPTQPTSIYSHVQQPQRKEYMTMAAQEVEARPLSKRMRPNTPPRPFSPRHGRDGIRKKNARFEIPDGRSLQNIDQLIADSKNDDEIKELKQQKRLLRNRQAALDSRQRKKKHTEELEEEKKIYTERLQSLEEEVVALRHQASAHMHEKEEWQRQQLDMRRIIEQLEWDKENFVRNHTLETGELRKKISVLTEKLEQSSMMSTVSGSTGFADFTSDMSNLNLVPNEWDNNYMFVHDFNVDAEPQHMPEVEEVDTKSQERAVVLNNDNTNALLVSDADKPVASGLLFMLLLCGAFVASKSSGTSAPTLPRMPDDVRAASATVLDSIFKDAGVAPSPTALVATPARTFALNQVALSQVNPFTESHEPGPSAVPWSKLTLTSADLSSMSTLDRMHAELTAATADQQNEQLFGITPAQYNSLTTVDFSRPPYGLSPLDEDDCPTPTSSATANAYTTSGQVGGHRRNLAQTLATMREEAKGHTAAEVYTRSLLWERIPTEVVMEFKRMVEENDAVAGKIGEGGGGGMVKT